MSPRSELLAAAGLLGAALWAGGAAGAQASAAVKVRYYVEARVGFSSSGNRLVLSPENDSAWARSLTAADPDGGREVNTQQPPGNEGPTVYARREADEKLRLYLISIPKTP